MGSPEGRHVASGLKKGWYYRPRQEGQAHMRNAIRRAHICAARTGCGRSVTAQGFGCVSQWCKSFPHVAETCEETTCEETTCEETRQWLAQLPARSSPLGRFKNNEQSLDNLDDSTAGS
eukprot:scaffold836_cov123-Isochrysis_galbana.AAC.17